MYPALTAQWRHHLPHPEGTRLSLTKSAADGSIESRYRTHADLIRLRGNANITEYNRLETFQRR
ncbi:hypothetical protein M404DRAFT_996120 [Pisolithus tinctorius Marx 270]|uniref:Uncharacterized protein n=1 Tax=Pisolithus tinctorius Marx 270 TaxID=870435 RepID=A0A0C3PP09_PISTI|nr:hypothetical protein M404DRAFT_996120 [Pisolithus tinctorius Marx 270]